MSTISRTPWGDQMEWDVGPMPVQTPPPDSGWTGKPVRPAPRPTSTNQWPPLFPTATRCHADFLIDGEDYYRALIDAINTATAPGHFIYVLGWMLDVDFPLTSGSSPTFLQLVQQAAARGVQVRILVWDNITPSYFVGHRRRMLPELRALKGDVRVFLDEPAFSPAASQPAVNQLADMITDVVEKHGPLAGSAIPAHLKPLLASALAHRVASQHDKAVIVKGRAGLVAFCGGIDVNPNRVTATVRGRTLRFPSYHDCAVRLTGPAAHQILQRFQRRWGDHAQARTVGLPTEPQPPEDRSVDTYALTVGTYNGIGAGSVDRTLRDAYFTIVDNARRYIYIEDQYMTNLDVAAKLNRKIKEPSFGNVTLVTQAASETTDILIPNRKRQEFMDRVLSGTTPAQQAKVVRSVIDNDKMLWQSEHYHPGLHAKTLIADDEIAIVGSANVNQRSFTCDSETSVVVFNTASDRSSNFAARLRTATLKHYLRSAAPAHERVRWLADATAWQNLPHVLGGPSGGPSEVVALTTPDERDLDLRIGDVLDAVPPLRSIAAPILQLQPNSPMFMFRIHLQFLLDRIWKEVLDPKV